MCGIAGLVSKTSQSPDNKILQNMTKALATRGPDGNGQYIHSNTGLVHTRLSIIDLSDGSQPMTNDKGHTIVFNGEIYNYVEIRENLRHEYNFKTQSDTEVILALYQKYGTEFITHLRGMFAFALHDPSQKRLILARDPFGIKPLYFSETHEHLAFASEIKALTHISFQIDPSLLRGFLSHSYLLGTQTPYNGITKINPGEVRIFEQGQCIASKTHSLLPTHAPTIETEEEALTKIDKTLKDSVNVHCRSDVGYGLFLSGGTDSTSIAVCLHKNGVKNIRSYTAAFDISEAADERIWAKQTAEDLNLIYHEVLFTENDFWTLLPNIAHYMDDPVADYANLPTWKLASEAAKEQKVVLCGEGGDELFAGYGRYQSRWWKDWRKLFKPDKRQANLSSNWTTLQKKQALDITHWLPNDLLVKLDNCLMAHGLEGRTPFLDPEVAKYAFALPDNLKQQGKNRKYLLKKWLTTQYPAYQAFRKKQGFTVPVGYWIDNKREQSLSVIKNSLLIKDMLTKAEYSALETLPSIKLWPLLYLSYWAKKRYQ